MKNIATTAILFGFLSFCIAQENPSTFNQYPYSQVFDMAKKSGKQVLLFFQMDGCGACIRMEKTVFTDSTVANLLNKDFLCLNINAKKGEGIEIGRKYQVISFPTMVICDAEKIVLAKNIGSLSSPGFINFCNNALTNNTSLPGIKEKYVKGNREPEFLRNYCYGLYAANEADSLIINEYMATQRPDELTKEENIRFIYTFTIANLKSNFDIYLPAFQFLCKNTDLFYPYYDTTQVNGRIVWVNSQVFNNSLLKKDYEKAYSSLQILSKYFSDKFFRVYDVNGVNKSIITYSENDNLINGILFQNLTGDKIEYNIRVRDFLLINNNDPDAYNSLVWSFTLYVDNMQTLSDAEKWIEQAIAINNNYAYNDTYAWLLFKEKKYKPALEIAERAIVLAKTNKEDYSGTTQLIEKIKAVTQ